VVRITSQSKLLNVVASKVNQIFGEEMMMRIAPALVWAAFDSTAPSLNAMPESMRQLIVNGFEG
jgi:hypothetical protein